ncbi:hypothetical protein GCM10009757_27970 [Streptomyces cheonanensis]|uniref:Uncharacterized protein n=2 Tax=Streptomyces cheonanensis TaxID=312720 RepID=A0ABN2V7F2_9ACTN
MRTPLATGYILLLIIWLAASEHIPEKDNAQGVWESAYHLSSLVGTPVTLAAISFIAYLIGCVAEIRARSIVHWFRVPDSWGAIARKIYTRQPGDPLNDPRLLKWIETPVTRRSPDDPNAPLSEVNSYVAVRIPAWGRRASRSALIDLAVYIHSRATEKTDIVPLIGRFGDELDQLAIRLQAGNPDLYSTYDRTVAEADLRVNVGFSSSLLVGAIAGKSSVEVFLLIPLTWLLIMRGQQKAREANDILIQAVVSGELKSSVLSSALPELDTATTTASDEATLNNTTSDSPATGSRMPGSANASD